MDRWNQFELFVQVAELGSLSKAAEAFDMSNAAASRALVPREDCLNARLVERNTRWMSLSAAGQDFYPQCKAARNQMKEAEAINAVTLAPTGTLRVTASLPFCMNTLRRYCRV